MKNPLNETFQAQLDLLKKSFSSRPPFHSDAKKMLELKAQGGCKGMQASKSSVLPQSLFREKGYSV
jgi:hypothetical protein